MKRQEKTSGVNISMTSTRVGQFFCMGYFLQLHNAIL